MPRIPTPLSIEVVHARALLASYLDQPNRSQISLSAISGVPQYTISKFLKGRIKSLTPKVKQLLVYVDNGIPQDISKLLSDPRIRLALDSAWDGSEHGTIVIASTIQALAPVLRGTSAQFHRH